jgi:lipopolysaccharide export system permease protein
MKRNILLRYMSRRFIANTAGAILGFAGLIELLDVLNNATDILARKLGAAGLGTYVFLRMPATLDQAITLGVLIGCILTFAQTARHHEMTAMRAAGVSIYRLGVLLLPCVALIALAHFAIADQLVPRSASALSVWWQSTAPPGSETGDEEAADKPLWFRLDGNMISIDRMLDGGRRLVGVHIYRREKGAFAGRTAAARADYDNGRWMLSGVVDTTVTAHGATEKSVASRQWNVRLAPAQLVELGLPAARLSTETSRSALASGTPSNRAPSFYEMQIQETYASALAAFVMLLLSLPVAFMPARDGRGGGLLAVSICSGLLYLLTNGVLDAFGESGALPPFAATWAALVIFTMLGSWFLLRLEDR